MNAGIADTMVKVMPGSDSIFVRACFHIFVSCTSKVSDFVIKGIIESGATSAMKEILLQGQHGANMINRLGDERNVSWDTCMEYFLGYLWNLTAHGRLGKAHVVESGSVNLIYSVFERIKYTHLYNLAQQIL